MHDPRSEEPLNDAALDREVEQLFGAQPSPGFVARVRTRVASERAPISAARRWRWPFAAAGALTAAGVAAAMYLGADRTVERASSGGSDVRLPAITAPSEPSGSGPLAGAQTSAARPSRRTAPHMTASAQRPKASDPIVAAAPAIDLPEVFVSTDEVKAFRALVAMSSRTRPGTSKATDVTESTSPLQTAAIVIPPIEIEPLALIARLEGEGE